ncbi:MAG: hypothetical protein HZY79_02585 [Rhodoblastus sp.]|nr:MAG: hypothetical protein HZY79_02585 [Rhodoblastus sp.]
MGTDKSALTEPSAAAVCPLRPPVAVALAVNTGLIASVIVLSPSGPDFDTDAVEARDDENSAGDAVSNRRRLAPTPED